MGGCRRSRRSAPRCAGPTEMRSLVVPGLAKDNGRCRRGTRPAGGAEGGSELYGHPAVVVQGGRGGPREADMQRDLLGSCSLLAGVAHPLAGERRGAGGGYAQHDRGDMASYPMADDRDLAYRLFGWDRGARRGGGAAGHRDQHRSLATRSARARAAATTRALAFARAATAFAAFPAARTRAFSFAGAAAFARTFAFAGAFAAPFFAFGGFA